MCHDGLVDTSGDNVSIVRDWGSSMMANATKDPFWRAKVATELERNPHLSTLINDKCSKCHAPIANYEINKVQGGEMSLFGSDGVLNPSHEFYDEAMNGVSCTVCHQIEDIDLGTPAGSSGQYSINNNKIIYGQFSNIFAQPMINNTGYMPAYSAHISDSALCASCHDLKTPYVDANGNEASTPESEFPEQMPYTEWQNSEFDDAGSNPQSCQDCHMPKTTSKVSSRPRWLETKDGFAKHHLVGANTTMLTLLKDNAAELDVISNNMDLSINRARNMLQSSVSVEIISALVTNGELEAHVQLVNNSGHKTPTAYPSRRMWLHFKVTDSNNTIVFESGKINTDGSIAGADNDQDQSIFEPHYNEITAADQVQIYETIMGNTDAAVTFTLLRSAQYLKDNRLTPKGFIKSNVPSDVAVKGLADIDADFNNGSDELTYRPLKKLAAGVFNVSVSLNYQTISHGFLQDLYADDNQLEQVLDFKRMYNAQTLKHETIDSTETNVISDGGGTTPPEPGLSLSASPSTIELGSSATLTWSSSYANSCEASGAWSGELAISDGTETVSPDVTSTYTITCYGDGGGDTSSSVTISVNQPPVVKEPTVSLVAIPSRVARGGTITLEWSSTDANSCSATGGWSGIIETGGSESMTLDSPTTFTLTCDGDGGSASRSIVYRSRGRKWLEIK